MRISSGARQSTTLLITKAAPMAGRAILKGGSRRGLRKNVNINLHCSPKLFATFSGISKRLSPTCALPRSRRTGATAEALRSRARTTTTLVIARVQLLRSTAARLPLVVTILDFVLERIGSWLRRKGSGVSKVTQVSVGLQDV